MFIRKFLQYAGPPAAAHYNRLGQSGRDRSSQNSTGQHYSIGIGHQGHNIQINPLQPGSGPLEIPMVDCQHHGPARLGIEYPGQPVLHPPIQRTRSLKEKTRRLHRNIFIKLFCFLYGISVSHIIILSFVLISFLIEYTLRLIKNQR